MYFANTCQCFRCFPLPQHSEMFRYVRNQLRGDSCSSYSEVMKTYLMFYVINILFWDILGSQSGVAVDSGLLYCDTVLIGPFQMFIKDVIP
jgi:hypothetical protein